MKMMTMVIIITMVMMVLRGGFVVAGEDEKVISDALMARNIGIREIRYTLFLIKNFRQPLVLKVS